VVEPVTLKSAWPHSRCIAASGDGLQWTVTNKYFTFPTQSVGGGKFGIFIDPTKCKAAPSAWMPAAITMPQNDSQDHRTLQWYRAAWDCTVMPETPANTSTKRRFPT